MTNKSTELHAHKRNIQRKEQVANFELFNSSISNNRKARDQGLFFSFKTKYSRAEEDKQC